MRGTKTALNLYPGDTRGPAVGATHVRVEDDAVARWNGKDVAIEQHLGKGIAGAAEARGVTLVFASEQEAMLLVALPALLFTAGTLVPRAGSLEVRLSWLKLLFAIM